MAEVRKPDGYGKVASVTFVFQLEFLKVSHQRFSNFLEILLVTPAT